MPELALLGPEDSEVIVCHRAGHIDGEVGCDQPGRTLDLPFARVNIPANAPMLDPFGAMGDKSQVRAKRRASRIEKLVR